VNAYCLLVAGGVPVVGADEAPADVLASIAGVDDVLLPVPVVPPAMLLPDEPPVEVAPDPASIAPLAGVEPAAPPLTSPPAVVAPPAGLVVVVPAVPVEPIVVLSVGVVVVVVVDDVSSAFFPHAPTLSAAATAMTLIAIRMMFPCVIVSASTGSAGRLFRSWRRQGTGGVRSGSVTASGVGVGDGLPLGCGDRHRLG